MKIPIKSKIRTFYSQIIKLLYSFAPINKLSPKEREVLAELMYHNYRLRSLNERDRHILLFSTENRKDMQKNLNVTADNFNVYLSNLRGYKILGENNRLPTFLAKILPKGEYEFTILFRIDDE